MSILKKAGAFGGLACALALGFAASASAQTKVYVKVVVGQQQAPVYAPQQYHAPHHVQQHASDAHVLYNRPHADIVSVQPYVVQSHSSQHYSADSYYIEPRKQSRWR